MPADRPRRTHSEESILRAVRDLLLEHGARGVTTAAVSERSGAPTGSLYHRFGSRSVMVAELWVRTIRSFHADVLAATGAAEPGVERAIALARAVVDFASHRPEDARLLLIASREELLADETLPAELAAAVATLNQPVEALVRQLTREIYGRVSPSALERVVLAVEGVPYTVVRRRLRTGSDPTPLWPLVERAARAILAD